MPFRIFLFILFSFITNTLLAQPQMNSKDPYAAQWTKADSLIGNGLPKSARAIVQQVYDEAKAKQQSISMLKAQLYFIRMHTQDAEDADSLNIALAEHEMRNTSFPLNAVWKSIAAQLYWQYYESHRYKILDRTHTSTKPEDFAQWDVARFAEQSLRLYQESLHEAARLKAIPIADFDPVLDKGVNTRNLRPTLFDLLAFRAIQFYSLDEKDISKPAFAFVMDDAAAFAPAGQFIKQSFKSQDSNSSQFQALLLYQEILDLHQSDNIPDAFIDADLQRLEFVNAHSVHPDKLKLYQKALKQIETSYPDNPLSAMASFRLASLMMNGKSSGMEDEDDQPSQQALSAPKIDLIAIRQKLEQIIRKFPSSEGASNAQGMLQQILSKLLSLKAEQTTLPDQPIRLLLSYKNQSQAWIRILKIDPQNYLGRLDEQSFTDQLTKMTPLRTIVQKLPGTEDLLMHSAELKLEGLPIGMYAILLSGKEDFSRGDNILCFGVFQSTGISIITQNVQQGKNPGGYVLDRKSGQALAGASLTFYQQQYNNSRNRYDFNPINGGTSNRDGSFAIPGSNTTYNGIKIVYGNDAFYSSEYLNFYRYDQPRQSTEQAFIFTDRSIYRPGQRIIYKAILVSSDADHTNSKVLAGKSVVVSFYDVNSQKVAEQKLTSNEWGSVTGSFLAPTGGLTGNMRLECSLGGNVYISVEEYKRPKFKVDWDTLKADYSLNESVIVTGHALAYAGNNVDGATVKYRVLRQTRWPFWYYSWLWGRNQSAEQEISHGESKSDANGRFIIPFQTIPDRSVDERSLPVFTYTVYADVTDLNGETRSGTFSLSAGYRSLQFKAPIPMQASPHDLENLVISTQNLNGEFVAATINLKITKLEQPSIVYRKRLWNVPDQFILSESEFRNAFPLDAYKNEDDYHTWKESAPLLDKPFTTSAQGKISVLPGLFSRNGWYCITIHALDKNGKAIDDKKFVQVWDVNNAGKAYTPLLAIPNGQNRGPGEQARIDVVTGLNGLHIIRQVQRMGEAIQQDQQDIGAEAGSNNWKQDIQESDRGGLALAFVSIKDNRVYTAQAGINVPWTNKELHIEWETHRDKLLPGSEETWTMIIRGNQKEKIGAELAATLYDASLDAFRQHYWSIPELFASLNTAVGWSTNIGFGQMPVRRLGDYSSQPLETYSKRYDQLMIISDMNSLLMELRINKKRSAYSVMKAAPAPGIMAMAESRADADGAVDEEDPVIGLTTGTYSRRDTVLPESQGTYGANSSSAPKDIPIRSNLQETAFFYPQLHTDAEGSVRIQFRIPEALTEWKLLALAHTKDMSLGYLTGTVKTQKDLMVQPGLPRFLRQGDDIELSTKVVNLGDKSLNGTASIEILDALTGKTLLLPFRITQPNTPFQATAGGSTSVSWKVHVPESRYEPVIIRILAKAGDFTDGEENTLPVISNRMLVTETLPLWMNGSGSKTFRFDKLLQSAGSTTLAQHAITLEYTSNPAWYAIQALPYLMEYPYECAEQTFNRFYANALAAHILDKAPRVKEIFKKWETASLLSSYSSPLEKNEELKSALLEETPWVMDAKNESQQHKNIALLFESAKLARELSRTAHKLQDMLLPEGGFPWFKGDNRPDPYITQYIISGIGHLKKLGVEDPTMDAISKSCMNYLDRHMMSRYQALLRLKVDLKAQQIGYTEIQYLYMRSFFKEIPTTGISTEATNFYKTQVRKFWSNFNPYGKGMIALILKRTGDKQTSENIIQSLRETAIYKEEMGMYWMDNQRSWWWWQAPIETQSLLIECFAEVTNDQETVDEMKRWLLKQKQTQSWSTTKSTADACYALLLQGSQWLNEDSRVQIKLGNETVASDKIQSEAGTGYFKIRFEGEQVKPEMGMITLEMDKIANATSSKPSWGAVYWQYFEDLDKITAAATPLQLKKQLFIERNTDQGLVLDPITNTNVLQKGDKVRSRIELIVDRDMEYVHLKDARASCFEPVNVLSGYQWQGGLGYYQSTKDVSSNFFFSYLPKGKYVFEYSLFVTNSGNFSNGIATIQCMYAPEFSAHSEGIRVQVK